MKLKLTLVAIATTFLLTGCGKEGAEPTTSTPSLESQQVDEKNVPVDPPKKTPEIVFDWEEPKEPYYTLGVSPLDAFDLITRYNLEEDVRVKSVFFATEKATTGFTVGDDSTTIYSHDNLQDAPETADDKEAAILGSIVTVGEAVEKKCKKITKAMADELKEADFTSPLTVLNDVDVKQIQTWYFIDKEGEYYLVTNRDVSKPKGYTYRCKKGFETSQIKPMLKGVSLYF